MQFRKNKVSERKARRGAQQFLSFDLPNRVIAQIEAKIVKPTPERPYEGIITIHSELSPMASTEYDTGRWVGVSANCMDTSSIVLI